MRMRRKKHLAERVEKVSDILTVSDFDVLNCVLAERDKKYFDYKSFFGNGNPVEMEIGCGKGGFIAKKAATNPNVNYLAVELLQNIIVTAAEKAKAENLSNVRFFNCGADYLGRYIPPESLSAVYLNFSPPYPGKRYINRRLTKDALVKAYKRFLKGGAAVYLKTDDKDFYDFSAGVFKDNGFSVSDYLAGCENDAETEYERKFKAMGLPIYAFKAVKPIEKS